MTFFAWIVLGLLAGFIASMLMNRAGEGLIGDIGLGIVGAFVGGFLFHLFGMRGTEGGLDPWSLGVAVLGAVIVLAIYHALMGRRRPLP